MTTVLISNRSGVPAFVSRPVFLFFILLLLISFLTPLLSSSHAEGAENIVSVSCTNLFQEGDTIAWAAYGFDDASWRAIPVPSSWQSLKIAPEGKIAWYRIHFTMPHAMHYTAPAVFLGRIGDADEVYLNGLKIGGEGAIGDRFIEASDVERLYKLPKELLKYGQDNVLAIRVMNTYVRGGLFESSVIIDEYEGLLVIKLFAEFKRKGIQFVYFFICLLFFVLIIIKYLAGVKEKEYIAFSVFILLFNTYWAFNSLSFYESGLKTHLIQKLIYAIPALFPVGIIIFMSTAFHDRPKILIRLIVVLSFGLFYGCLFFLGNRAFLRIFDTLWIGLIAFSIFMVIFLSYRAYKRRVLESTPVIIGLSVLVLTSVGEVLAWESISDFGSFYFTSPGELGVLFLIFCVAYSMDIRFARSLRSMTIFSMRIISAHDEERRRIAFDLHDGLGQTLAALKLKTQMYSAAPKGGDQGSSHHACGEIVRDISGAIQELREILMDLRPPAFEEMSLGELIFWYAQQFAGKTGMQITVEGAASLPPVNKLVKENLFRICQEAFGNAARHSGASFVSAIFRYEDSMLSLMVQDNGHGFSLSSLAEKEKGLGLQTMKERTELLGGYFLVKSSPEGGTEIFVEVRLT